MTERSAKKRKDNVNSDAESSYNEAYEDYLVTALSGQPVLPPTAAAAEKHQMHKKENEDSEDLEQGREFWVYVLESLASPHYSYVGFTVDRGRRLRQHNGELKCGGANYTHGHRPWRMMLSIRGNSEEWWTKQAALQLEWRIKHVSKGRGAHRRRPKGDPVNIKSNKKQCRWRTFRIPNHPAIERRVNDILWLLHNRRKWTKNSPSFSPERSLTIEMHPSILTREIQEFAKNCSFWNIAITPNPDLPTTTN